MILTQKDRSTQRKAFPTARLPIFPTKWPECKLNFIKCNATIIIFIWYRKHGCVMVSMTVPEVKTRPSVSLRVKKISSGVEMLVATIQFQQHQVQQSPVLERNMCVMENRIVP
jgi:hypothetical protein